MPSKSESWGKVGAYVGTTIGVLGWLIGFTILCLVEGATGLLAQVLLPGLLLSLSLALIFIIMLEAVIRIYGPRHSQMFLTMWGMLFTLIGIMLMLINHWIAPLIDRHPDLAGGLRRTGSVYRVDDIVPTFLLAAGVVLLLIVMLRFFSGPKPKTDPPE
ncbi:MAG: hypothetical protein ACYTAF_04805 [Planctomycetota bacterium]|jgi:hypothetical protein